MNDNIIKEALLNNPHILKPYTDKIPAIGNLAKNLLPYSVGIEFECDRKPTYEYEDFASIPFIMDIDVDNYEQRYRIPPNLEGFYCLYDIMMAMIKNSILYTDGGIHFHIDCTDTDIMVLKKKTHQREEEILNIIKTWEYNGTGNPLGINYFDPDFFNTGNAINFNPLGTMEFRRVQQTFIYSELLPKILTAQKIVYDLKNEIVEKGQIAKIIKHRIIKI